MIYNEEINAARWALREAAEEFRRFSDDRNDEELVQLFRALLDEEGIRSVTALGYDPALYERVRQRLKP